MTQYEISMDIVNKLSEITKLQLDINAKQRQVQSLKSMRDLMEISPIAPIRCSCKCCCCE